jgi:hypothetical protein
VVLYFAICIKRRHLAKLFLSKEVLLSFIFIGKRYTLSRERDIGNKKFLCYLEFQSCPCAFILSSICVAFILRKQLTKITYRMISKIIKQITNKNLWFWKWVDWISCLSLKRKKNLLIILINTTRIK